MLHLGAGASRAQQCVHGRGGATQPQQFQPVHRIAGGRRQRGAGIGRADHRQQTPARSFPARLGHRRADKNRDRHAGARGRQHLFWWHHARERHASPRQQPGARHGALTTTGSVVDYANGVTIANQIVVNSNTTQLQVTAGIATQAGVISQLNGTAPAREDRRRHADAHRRQHLYRRHHRQRRHAGRERLDRQFGRDREHRRHPRRHRHGGRDHDQQRRHLRARQLARHHDGRRAISRSSRARSTWCRSIRRPRRAPM